MKTFRIIIPLSLLIFTGSSFSQNRNLFPEITPAGKGIVRPYVDNISYWKKMTRLGYVKTAPVRVSPPAVFTGSRIDAPGIFPQDSPDVPVTNISNTTQSENSVFIDPENEDILLNSNNSSDWNGTTASTLYGADALYSLDTGLVWLGTILGAGITNGGDPAAAIGPGNRWYVGRISNDWGQSLAISTNQGQTWSDVQVAPGPGGYNLLDKNHLWVDNAAASPFRGYLYAAWTAFITGGPDDKKVEFVRSTDNGLTWSAPFNISNGVNSLVLDHGVNIHTGPNGEVYAAWSIYDTWPADENAIGFARSFDGGGIFATATRIISNIKGIRNSLTSKNMRVNAFPSMAVDISSGPNRGTIYIVWSNRGVPGVNTGNDIDIYMIRSSDQGTTWSAPIRVNQDPIGLGKEHYFPWISCDATTGNLCVIYYDDRNASSTQCQTWVSYSYDKGDSWTDMKVGDYTFTPTPISGMASGYFGDYIGIQASNMWAYPVWTDNRNNKAMTYVSPLFLGPAPNQPYITYYSYSLSPADNPLVQTMNYGDSLYLTLSLQDIGDLPASNVSAYVSTDSPFVTITDSIADYGNFSPGDIKNVPNGYTFKVSDTIPDGLSVRFNIRSTDGDSTWYSRFFIESHAPALRIMNLTIIDTATGCNHNYRLDPGEDVSIVFTLKNTGDFTCYNTKAELSTTYDLLTLQNNSVLFDSLTPGMSVQAVFYAHVDEEASYGTGVDLFFKATSGKYHTQGSYIETIGLIVEDWETHTFTKFPWQFAGYGPWNLTGQNPYEGLYCSRSGIITDSQSSQLILNYTTGVDDSISFYYKVSSEPDYDFLNFYIDGVLQGEWSGEQPWTRAAFLVSTGTHIFKWSYVKDIFLSVGEDAAWLDFIEFPPPPLPQVSPGANATICAGQTFQLQASGTGYDSLLWTTLGDGTFNNDTILNPVYTPGSNDIINGIVKLRLTAFGPYGNTIKSMNLTIGNIPVVDIMADPNDTLCAGQTVLLSIDTSNIASYLWTPGNYQTPVIAIDTSMTGGIGATLFRVVATNHYGCSNSDSTWVVFRDCTGINETKAGFTAAIYPNPANEMVRLDISAANKEELNIRMIDNRGVQYINWKNIIVQDRWTREIDLQHFPSGIYYFILEGRNGRIIRKLVHSVN